MYFLKNRQNSTVYHSWNPKPPPPDGAKSNPSKRHRDRLNGELDKLTSLLPFSEEVRARLDKLSVLRLSVGYLKVKSFFNASNQTSNQTSRHVGGFFVALNGFVLVVTAEGYIFFTSPTIQDYLGFHQSDVVHQSVFELIHTDDRSLFRRQLHFALKPGPGQYQSAGDGGGVVTYDPQLMPPENSSFLERSFCCRFRCLLDNSSGFLALNFHGRLKFLHGQGCMSQDGTLLPPQLALFCIATPVQPPSILEIRTKTLIFQTKHRLDFAPLGIDTRGKVVLGYSETELCMKGSGYQFIHAADMMYCADNHLRMIKTGDSGFNVFRLLTKAGTWIWVQASARLVFKAGKPDFIVARQRALTNEEGEEQLRLRRLQLPFNFATGEAVLYDVSMSLDVPSSCSAPKQKKLDDLSIDPNSLLGCMLSQDQGIYCQHNNDNTLNSLNDAAFEDTHALVNVPGDARQHPSPKPVTSLVKAEGTVQDMMETLQQILGENDLTTSLDVDPEELKDWENTLLKMSSTPCEVSEDLDELLSNDILSYVEEQLIKEGGLKLPDQLDDVPVCLPSLDLQTQDPVQGGEQSFGWLEEPQNQLIPNGGQMVAEKQTPISGRMKLTHVGPPQLSSAGLNGPTLQQIAAQNPFTPSTGLHSELSSAGNLGTPGTFDPLLADSCAQTQNQLRNLHVTTNNNSLGLCSLRQTSANQLHSNQIVQPIQNHLQMRMSDLPIGLHNQSSETLLNPMFPCQSSQWISSVPNSNQTDNFVETYTPNISIQSDFNPDPSSSSCLQGHFALQTQNGENQRQSWPLEQQQQQLPTLISNGHHHTGGFHNPASGFQRSPLQTGIAPQTSVNCRPTFRPPNTAGMRFPAQQEMEPPALVPSSSCMFGGATPSVPVNGVHLNQRLSTTSNQTPSKTSCYYQSLPGSGSVAGMGVISQVTPDVGLSCQGLDPDGLLVQQQQQPYLNFSEQTQVKTVS
uniref:Aryl hydrocarbon receptor n=1 Tax=Myripristis murdjan TaxID=586833 RepID=A0A667Y288_9TELE